MKKITFITSTLLIILLFSCKTVKECPEFNYSDLQEVCYNEFDTLTFMNSQSEEFNIYIQEFYFSTSFEQECSGVERICPCLNNVEVMATNTLTNNPFVFLRMEQSDVSEMQIFKYQVFDFYFEIDFINEVSNIDDFPYMELSPNFTIDNTSYNNVVILSNLENPSLTVSKVCLNKTNGILKIVKKDGTIWTRVEL